MKKVKLRALLSDIQRGGAACTILAHSLTGDEIRLPCILTCFLFVGEPLEVELRLVLAGPVKRTKRMP